MGCKSSKQVSRVPSIDSTFPLTSNPDLDSFFQRSSLLLRDIETIRLQINAKKQQGTILAGTHLAENAYTKAVQVLFWALSASQEGKISKTGLTITDSAPFIRVQSYGQCRETVELTTTLQEYLVLLLGKPKFLEEWERRLEEIRNEQVQMKRKIGPGMSSKAIRVTDENMLRLTDAVNAGWRVVNQLIAEQKDTMELLRYMQAIAGMCDEVGRRAYIANATKPAEIYKWAELNPGLFSDVGMMGIEKRNNEENNAKAMAVSSEKYVSFGDIQGCQAVQWQDRMNNNNNLSIDLGESSAFSKDRQMSVTQKDKLMNSQSGTHSKARIFIIEKGLEIMIRDTQEELEKAGYLSPGGTKQAGILQGEENILEDEDTMCAPTNESAMIRSFTIKAQGCFVNKE